MPISLQASRLALLELKTLGWPGMTVEIRPHAQNDRLSPLISGRMAIESTCSHPSVNGTEVHSIVTTGYLSLDY
jgi:hypothetical protein